MSAISEVKQDSKEIRVIRADSDSHNFEAMKESAFDRYGRILKTPRLSEELSQEERKFILAKMVEILEAYTNSDQGQKETLHHFLRRQKLIKDLGDIVLYAYVFSLLSFIMYSALGLPLLFSGFVPSLLLFLMISMLSLPILLCVGAFLSSLVLAYQLEKEINNSELLVKGGSLNPKKLDQTPVDGLFTPSDSLSPQMLSTIGVGTGTNVFSEESDGTEIELTSVSRTRVD